MHTVHCCKDCKPPKRHAACHDTCEEYIAEKKHIEEIKQIRGVSFYGASTQAKLKKSTANFKAMTRYSAG